MIACLLLLFSGGAYSEWVSTQWDVMGTRATLEFWRDTPPTGASSEDPLVRAVQAEFQRLNDLLSPWQESSELARVNAQAAQQPVTISAEFMQLLKRSEHYFRLTDGAFDISFASAGVLYDYRAGKAPDGAQLAEARALIGFRYIRLDGNRVSFTREGVRIDLGGIAKGYAIDQAVALLRTHGIHHAYISLGGDSYVLGDRRGRDWQVGIRHPRNGDAVAMRLPLSDTAVSTSGDYERFFIRDGQRIHHIINPGTGRSSEGLVSVTVLAPAGIDADALSTSVFVMGKENGLALVNRLENVSAIVIDANGQVAYSNDLVSPEDAGR